MPKKLFEAGNPGGPGRPEGSKNRNAMRPLLWWNWFEDEVQKLPEAERIPQIKWAIEQMMPKVPVLPASPGDSASNAANAFGLLNGIAPMNDLPQVPPSAPHANGGPNGNGSNGAI